MFSEESLSDCAVRFVYNNYTLDFEGTILRANDRDALAKAYVRHVMQFEGECSVCGGEDE